MKTKLHRIAGTVMEVAIFAAAAWLGMELISKLTDPSIAIGFGAIVVMGAIALFLRR